MDDGGVSRGRSLALGVSDRRNGSLSEFELMACYHQNLGIFWGVWLF